VRGMTTGRYKHIFFDLDHTLWDFEKSSAETLTELYADYFLRKRISCTCEEMIERFIKINDRLWEEFSSGKISKEELRFTRFREVFQDLGELDDSFFEQFGADYLKKCPQKGNLLPYAREVLHYLSSKYDLHVITNGFEEVQFQKLLHSGIQFYFKQVITSDKTGCRKPEKKMFSYAMEKVDCKPQQCIMIGDNLQADMVGASNSQIDHIFYNPQKIKYFIKVTHEINCLSELMTIL
jgi:putative hydrolase of the HAD superfamily